jgi:TPR repeat protein
LRCAAELGHGEAMYLVGRSLPPVDAVPWYERAIRLQHAEAINAHAELLQSGIGVSRNPTLAEERFKIAAQLGSNAAYVNYARLQESRDMRSAQRWYRAAAERGYPPAQRIYGEILLTEGFGIYRNDGLDYLRQAAAAKDAPAAYRLGQLYAAGQYVERSEELARQYFVQARDSGHPDAAARLRELGERG